MAQKAEHWAAGVYAHIRAALLCAEESKEQIGSDLEVREWNEPKSAKIDAQPLVVLSALSVGASFDIVTSSGGVHGFESWCRLHKICDPSLEKNPVTATRKNATTVAQGTCAVDGAAGVPGCVGVDQGLKAGSCQSYTGYLAWHCTRLQRLSVPLLEARKAAGR